MNDTQLDTERRQNQRFLVNKRAIAVLNIGASSVRLGQIFDVSRSGLAFDYLHMDTNIPQTKRDDEVGRISLNIINEDGFMVLGGVTVLKANDRFLSRVDESYITVPTFRCGVHFDTLSPFQNEQLVTFLLQQTVYNA